MRESPIPDDVVYKQVSHILASQAFRKSIRLRRLLEFIVDATVKGETTSLKEWVIGTDVYNRGPDFDPRLDPIVRTEIRRLRRKLTEYFETEGREDPIVIEVPKGSYIPSFRDRRNDDLFKLPGETIGDYFVLDRLDESFDTVTYRVRHNSSDRVLALKVIAGAALASPGVRQSLEADITAATALRHENLCHVYGLQHSRQNVCVITEYFEGQQIADVVDRGQLTWEQTLDIARQLISGLAAAHRLHIVHGNLNVSNVVVALRNAGERPALKILDFGTRSMTGGTAGDRRHLSPDELDTGAVDERSDIRGAGTVLHKLFTGLVGKCEPSATGWHREVPEEKRSALTAVLTRCLAASPADRYADAREVEDALDSLGAKSRPEKTSERPDASAGKNQERAWRLRSIPRVALRNLIAVALICVFVILVAGAKEWVTPSGTNMVRRLAVFPVECPPGDQECDALGLALNRSLATQLTNTGGLDVVRADIVAQFKAQRLPALQVASQLKGDHLLTGTIEKHADTRRFSARIIRVADQDVQWAGNFECSWSTLSEIQSQLLNRVMVIVNSNSPATMRARPRHFGARSADEQGRYARARHAIDTLVTVRERVYFDYAQKQLQSALKANPEFNDARILLAQLYYQEIWGAPQRSQLLENSRLLLEAAIQKEPERAESHALLGGVLAEAGHREQGMEFVRRALMLGPLDSTPHRELAKLYAEAGFFESALVEEDRALALDPSNLAALTLKIFLLSWMGKQAEADSALRALREWQPAGLADRLDADRELRTGNYVAANHLIATALEHTSNPVNRQASEIARALCAVLLGEQRQAIEVFQRHPDQPPRFFDHYILLAAQLGDARRVVDYIRHNPLYFNYRYLVAEPRLAPVRSEPIFRALLEEAYSRWQSDLARYGPSLPAAPELRHRPTGTSGAAVMAGLAQRQGHAAVPQN